MAIEDAVVLAKCLRDAASVDRAFVDYEQIRRARVERVVAQGKKNGDGKTPGPLGRVVRDLMLRIIFRRGRIENNSQLGWMLDRRISWESRMRYPLLAAMLLLRLETSSWRSESRRASREIPSRATVERAR